MKIQSKWKKIFFHSFIVLFISVMFLHPIGTVLSDENDENVSEHSGGFIVESDRVEGQMDLLGALGGKIDIAEGKIHGLTMTKVLETSDNQEPLVIKITSSGPIPVSNLYAETVGNTLPEFSGICISETLGWLCLQDVKMTVSEQTAGSIVLPNAKVVTCYESECGIVPEPNSLKQEDLASMLQEKEVQNKTLDEIVKEVEEGLMELEKLKGLLSNLDTALQTMKEEDVVTDMESIISNISSKLEMDNVTETLKTDILALTEELNKKYEGINKNTNDLEKLSNDIHHIIQSLDEKVAHIDLSIEELENVNPDTFSLEAVQGYSELFKELEDEQLLQSMQINSDDINTDISKSEDDKTEMNIEDVKEKLVELKDEFQLQKEYYDAAKENLDNLKSQRDTLKQKIQVQREKIISILNTNEEEQSEEEEQPEEKESTEKAEEQKADTPNNEEEQNNEDTNNSSEEDKEDTTENDSEETNNEEENKEEESNLIKDLLGWLLGL